MEPTKRHLCRVDPKRECAGALAPAPRVFNRSPKTGARTEAATPAPICAPQQRDFPQLKSRASEWRSPGGRPRRTARRRCAEDVGSALTLRPHCRLTIPPCRHRRYGGAYTPPEKEAEDVKPAIEAACHPKCASVWEIYKQCEERVAEKVRVHAASRGRVAIRSCSCVRTCSLWTEPRRLTLVVVHTGRPLLGLLHGLLPVRR